MYYHEKCICKIDRHFYSTNFVGVIRLIYLFRLLSTFSNNTPYKHIFLNPLDTLLQFTFVSLYAWFWLFMFFFVCVYFPCLVFVSGLHSFELRWSLGSLDFSPQCVVGYLVLSVNSTFFLWYLLLIFLLSLIKQDSVKTMEVIWLWRHMSLL